MVPDIPHRLNRVAHYAGIGLAIPLHLASRMVVADEPPSQTQIRQLRRLRMNLIDQDLENARQGHYPRRLVFDRASLRDPIAWPLALRDFLSIRTRRESKSWKLAADQGAGLPPYYRRRFHWQKDGYLSDRSARRYDLGVELLFLGAADTMRRAVIPPLQRATGGTGRVLDVACGTGRTLSMLAAASPSWKLYGVDLSPHYIRRARQAVDHTDLSLLVENAENLPFPDGYFDAVTSTFLFHELPHAVRRTVTAELFRVVKPGGTVVIEDAAQLREAGEMGPLLHAFHQSLHEPFFDDHLRDPIEDYVTDTGFIDVEVQRCYVAKVVTGRKPASAT